MRQEARASPAIRRGSRLRSFLQSCLASRRGFDVLGGTHLFWGWQGQSWRQYFFFFLNLLHDLKLFEGLCDYEDDGCISPGGRCSGELVTPGTASGRGAVPGREGAAGHGRGLLSKLGISYPVSVSFAGCNPTACADGKSGEGNRTVLSGLWVTAPPRRGWDGREPGGRAGVRGGRSAHASPRRVWGGLAGGFAWGSTAGAFGACCAGAGVWWSLSWTRGTDSGGDVHHEGLGTGGGVGRAERVGHSQRLRSAAGVLLPPWAAAL